MPIPFNLGARLSKRRATPKFIEGHASIDWKQRPQIAVSSNLPITKTDSNLLLWSRNIIFVLHNIWPEGEDADRLIYELAAKARKLPFLKEREIIPVLFLKQKPVRESDALVMTPQEIIDAIG